MIVSTRWSRRDIAGRIEDLAKSGDERWTILRIPINHFEGNYVCQSAAPWSTAAALMDERWFVSVPFPVARARLIRRHLAAGIAEDEEAAARRADENDLVNGEEIVRLLLPVDEMVESREDAAWLHG